MHLPILHNALREPMRQALEARVMAVPDAVRERILAEKDLARLERWNERAIVAASVADVIDDPS